MAYAPEFFDDPFDGKGFLVHETPTKRTWICDRGNGVTDMCEIENVDPVIEANRGLYNESIGKRWKDGQIVASIPSSIYWRGDFKKARENNDQEWIKKFLNDPDNQKLRTFRGRL